MVQTAEPSTQPRQWKVAPEYWLLSFCAVHPCHTLFNIYRRDPMAAQSHRSQRGGPGEEEGMQ